MHVPWSTELSSAVSILERRLTRRLRHDNGLLYEFDVDITGYGGDVATIGIGADIKDGDVWAVANTVIDVLDDLADAGPTDAELAHDRESFREFLGDPDVVREAAYDAAAAHLLGTVPEHVVHIRKLAGYQPRMSRQLSGRPVPRWCSGCRRGTACTGSRNSWHPSPRPSGGGCSPAARSDRGAAGLLPHARDRRHHRGDRGHGRLHRDRCGSPTFWRSVWSPEAAAAPTSRPTR